MSQDPSKLGSAIPRRSDRIVSRRGDDVVILLDPVSGEYFTLDDVGGRIWELCDGSTSIDQIVAAIAEEYDASAEQVRTDVDELLSELRGSKLLAD
jgi:coenzyme PQQ biosynthesis protein PqqD